MKGMWKCAKKGDTKEFVKLLSKGDNVNEKDTANRTPLHYAAEFGTLEIAQLILTKGGTMDIKDHKGETPLEIAVQNGHEDFAVMLVSAGASLQHLFEKDNKRFIIPKRLELKLKEAELSRKLGPSSGGGGGGGGGQSNRFNASGSGSGGGAGGSVMFVDKSAPVFDEPTFTAPDVAPLSLNEQSFLSPTTVSSHPVPVVAPAYSRATPAPPSFKTTASRPASENPARPPTKTESMPSSGNIRASDAKAATSPVLQSSAGGGGGGSGGGITAADVGGGGGGLGNALDLKSVVLLGSRIVHAALPDQFNPTLLQDLNAAVSKLDAYLPKDTTAIRVVSHHLREAGPFPVLGPLDVRRSKRVRDDYVAITERIRPVQDALRVLAIDRRAQAPLLVHPPVLYLIGGIFSILLSIEQPYMNHFDQTVADMTRVVRELSTTPASAGAPLLAQLGRAFVHFLRHVSVRLLEICDPRTSNEVTLMLFAMAKALRAILQDPSSSSVGLKPIAENLKNIMITIKANLPSRMGKELSPTEEGTLYTMASEMFAQTSAIVAQRSRDARETSAVRNIANQVAKIQIGMKDFNATNNIPANKRGGGGGMNRGALGRALLSDAQQLTSYAVELAAIACAPSNHNNNAISWEEWKEGRVKAAEGMVLLSLMVELCVACLTVGNRLPHHSHVSLFLSLFSVASHFAVCPYFTTN